MKKGKGLIVVISAPSGTGKTTICKKLVEVLPKTVLSVSVTTRKKRPGEKDGRDYFFVSETEFNHKMKRNELIEWSNVYGAYYGIPKQFLEKHLRLGYSVIVSIDVQGQKKIKAKFPNNTVSIFLLPPSWKALEERLRRRKSDTEDSIRIRLHKAKEEAKQMQFYDYVVVNDDIDHAVEKVKKLILAERLAK
ncbi:MAG: guanylate kinase [bacterium]|nr:guanylate kinase [bacterium]